MKTVSSAGGQVRFRVPKHWQQEADGNGTMLYAPEPNSGTLRLNVLTFRNPEPTPSDPPELADEAEVHGVPLELLLSGAYMVRTRKKFREEEDDCSMETWQLEVKEGYHVVIAIFTFTLLEEQMSGIKYQDQLMMLDHEIRGAEIQI